MARKVADNAKDFHADAVLPCSHQDCRIPAMCRIKTKTGWANMCNKHYDQYYSDQAHASLDKYGLAKQFDETNAEHVARMREFVRQGFKKIGTLHDQ